MFSREEIRRGLVRLGELALAEQKIIDIAVYGGSAIVLAWGFRVATRDVDAVVQGDADFQGKEILHYGQKSRWFTKRRWIGSAEREEDRREPGSNRVCTRAE